jgi:hypothetical protein
LYDNGYVLTVPTDVHNFFANPVDDVGIFLLGLLLRFFIKTDKASVRILLYILPVLLRYIKRYYKSGYMHEELTLLEAKLSLLKKRHKSGRIEMLG